MATWMVAVLFMAAMLQNGGCEVKIGCPCQVKIVRQTIWHQKYQSLSYICNTEHMAVPHGKKYLLQLYPGTEVCFKNWSCLWIWMSKILISKFKKLAYSKTRMAQCKGHSDNLQCLHEDTTKRQWTSEQVRCDRLETIHMQWGGKYWKKFTRVHRHYSTTSLGKAWLSSPCCNAANETWYAAFNSARKEYLNSSFLVSKAWATLLAHLGADFFYLAKR